MISASPRLSADELRQATGWELKPEGLCRDDLCMPFPSDDLSGVDLELLSRRLGMPLLHDADHGVWALGPESGGRFLAEVRFPELTLPDLDGEPFAFASLSGRKVVMVAWASW